MIKKKLLVAGGTAILACSSFGTSIFADDQAGTEHSVEVEMTLDDNGQVVYEYTDEEGITRTSTTTSLVSLTQDRFDKIYSINKWDSDCIVITVKEVPEGGAKASFELWVATVKRLLVLREHNTVKVHLGVRKVVEDGENHTM